MQRVTTLLEAKNIAYAIEYIDLSNKPDWFVKISPNVQVPILLLDDGEVLFESDAIVEYLDETTGTPLAASNPITRAQDRAWAYLGTKHYLVQCSAQRSPDNALLVERQKKLARAFQRIENQIGTGPFFRGKEFGMVDVAWMVLLHRASIIEACTSYDFLHGFSKLKEWQKACLQTGLAEKSVSVDFVTRFSNFYLAADTWLGQQMRTRSGQACCGPSACRVEDMACCA